MICFLFFVLVRGLVLMWVAFCFFVWYAFIWLFHFFFFKGPTVPPPKGRYRSSWIDLATSRQR